VEIEPDCDVSYLTSANQKIRELWKNTNHSLEIVLGHSQFYPLFYEFCVKSQAGENLLFWKELEQYEKTSQRLKELKKEIQILEVDKKSRFKTLIEKYLDPNAKTEVNFQAVPDFFSGPPESNSLVNIDASLLTYPMAIYHQLQNRSKSSSSPSVPSQSISVQTNPSPLPVIESTQSSKEEIKFDLKELKKQLKNEITEELKKDLREEITKQIQDILKESKIVLPEQKREQPPQPPKIETSVQQDKSTQIVTEVEIPDETFVEIKRYMFDFVHDSLFGRFLSSPELKRALRKKYLENPDLVL